MPDGATRRGSASRGVAYWEDREREDARVSAVVGSTLVALNARTGARYPDFGVDGEVDLPRGYDTRTVTQFAWQSAPLVVNDVVIVGSAVTDFVNETMPARKEMPPGDVRGFDVRTDEQLWIVHTVPQEGEAGNETWLTSSDEDRASWEYTGNTNMWAWPIEERPVAAGVTGTAVFLGEGVDREWCSRRRVSVASCSGRMTSAPERWWPRSSCLAGPARRRLRTWLTESRSLLSKLDRIRGGGRRFSSEIGS